MDIDSIILLFLYFGLLLSGLVALYCIVKHYLSVRDQEWIAWAKKKGINGDWPLYGEKS